MCRPVLCRAVPCRHGGGGAKRPCATEHLLHYRVYLPHVRACKKAFLHANPMSPPGALCAFYARKRVYLCHHAQLAVAQNLQLVQAKGIFFSVLGLHRAIVQHVAFIRTPKCSKRGVIPYLHHNNHGSDMGQRYAWYGYGYMRYGSVFLSNAADEPVIDADTITDTIDRHSAQYTHQYPWMSPEVFMGINKQLRTLGLQAGTWDKEPCKIQATCMYPS